MGAAVAKRLAGDGYTVVCSDLNVEGAAKVASGLAGARAEAVDITDPASVDELINSCGDDLEAVVHAAGILSSARVLELSLEDFDRIVSVNPSFCSHRSKRLGRCEVMRTTQPQRRGWWRSLRRLPRSSANQACASTRSRPG
jgi:NAD(P)-dependent dehydrogenase (short-subunit alcohol dehydrogenase family)